jgi:hypothetical protein
VLVQIHPDPALLGAEPETHTIQLLVASMYDVVLHEQVLAVIEYVAVGSLQTHYCPNDEGAMADPGQTTHLDP